MQFVLKPSLEHIALVKIAVSLWNQNDVSASISKLSHRDLRRAEWEKIEGRVIDKVLQLSLPQLLKEKVFGIIKPIGIQILKWMQYYRRYDSSIEFHYYVDLDLPAHLPAELCWTVHGTVDKKRTAEVLIKDENLNVFRRYCLACDYLLEDDIIRFWNRLPEDVKDNDWSKFTVVCFWSNNMKRGGAGHISFKDVFYSSVHDSNKIAAKYFLQKLNPQEREECLKELAKYLKDADVLCFLLTEMEEEQQMLVFKSDPCGVLRCFLQWPWQSFYIGVANSVREFLSEEICEEILGYIISKVRHGYKDYNYQKLFGEFWQKSPRALKDSLIKEIDKSWILHSLFDMKDKENIRLILKDASLTKKKKLIYSDEIYDYLARSVWANEWDFLEFCIRECLPSKDEMLEFKVEFEKRSPYTKEHLEKNKHKWSQIFCFSDDSIYKYDKRSVEEGESSSSKRLQSLQ